MNSIHPTTLALAYLDDRLLWAPSWLIMEQLFQATLKLDRASGLKLNAKTSACAFVTSQSRFRVPKPAGCLEGVPIKKVIKYLGADLRTQVVGHSAVAASRTADFVIRCGLIGVLPTTQKVAALCDAVSALWLDGGAL